MSPQTKGHYLAPRQAAVTTQCPFWPGQTIGIMLCQWMQNKKLKQKKSGWSWGCEPRLDYCTGEQHCRWVPTTIQLSGNVLILMHGWRLQSIICSMHRYWSWAWQWEKLPLFIRSHSSLLSCYYIAVITSSVMLLQRRNKSHTQSGVWLCSHNP